MIQKFLPLNINYTNQKPFVSSFKAENASFDSNIESENTVQKVMAPSLLAYLQGVNAGENISVLFSIPIDNLEKKYEKIAYESINELKSRAGKTSQELAWINNLPEIQINRLDEIYSLANSMKANGPRKLGIIGIGGSKHTIENMLSLNKKADNVIFLSAVDPDSMSKFIEKLGDLKDVSIMIASKSGTTLEPSTGYEYVEKAFLEYFKNEYKKEGLSDENALNKAQEEVSKHFVCITDKDESKSKLRKIAQQKGYKCGVIHDGCVGRFGAFDDHTLTALAWAGMSKSDMKKMLEASLKAQKRFMELNFDKNLAMQRAMFNADCIINGKTNQHDYYFGDVFEGTKLWNTQMKKESHKSLYRVSADLIGPEFLHNSTESDLDSNNKTSFYTFNKLKNNHSEQYKAYNALIDGSFKSYSERHPVALIELKDLSPESIGEFVELKHFEAMYTGMMVRALNSQQENPNQKLEILPEVTQPNVNIYKAEVKKILQS